MTEHLPEPASALDAELDRLAEELNGDYLEARLQTDYPSDVEATLVVPKTGRSDDERRADYAENMPDVRAAFHAAGGNSAPDSLIEEPSHRWPTLKPSPKARIPKP